MNRSDAREYAFKLLYEMEVHKEENKEEQIELFIKNNEIEDKKTIDYICDIVNGTISENNCITKLISDNLKSDWNIERISKINKALLKLATYEIVYKQLPYKVVINEVVELAKKYGEETSHQFINGLLASIVKEKQ